MKLCLFPILNVTHTEPDTPIFCTPAVFTVTELLESWSVDQGQCKCPYSCSWSLHLNQTNMEMYIHHCQFWTLYLVFSLCWWWKLLQVWYLHSNNYLVNRMLVVSQRSKSQIFGTPSQLICDIAESYTCSGMLKKFITSDFWILLIVLMLLAPTRHRKIVEVQNIWTDTKYFI